MPAAARSYSTSAARSRRCTTAPMAGVKVGARIQASASTPTSASQSRGRYRRPLRASSPTSRAMLVNCMATPSSQARATAWGPRVSITSAIMAPTAPATRAP